MPRPKVRPDARRRVVNACRQCKASKRKCNGLQPCAHCVKRHLSDACEFVGGALTPRNNSLRQRQGRSQCSSSEHSALPSEGPSCGPSCEVPAFDPRIENEGSYDTGLSSGQGLDATSPSATRARMLDHNQGEQVYVGRSASLSFLQLVRETIARCIGPSEFSDYTERDQMLEVDHSPQANIEGEIRLTPTQQQHFIDHFFLATNGLIHFLTPSEAIDLLVSIPDDETDRAAMRLLIIAIGAQTIPVTDLGEAQLEKIAFSQARKLAFSSMLEHLTLDMVRVFLLMAFYMLGACRRNTAYMYIGVAARAAHTLGLHNAESYRSLEQGKRCARLRCWKSLVSLDLMVSSILGRAPATSSPYNGENHTMRITDDLNGETHDEMEATYRLALLVDTIAYQFTRSETITAQASRLHLESLRRWTAILPARLRPLASPESPSISTRQRLVGSLHISCFYYFTVMLVTRPFLILHVIRSLSRTYSSTYQNVDVDASDDDSDLSTACSNAAMYMAQTCGDALRLDLLTESMRLLKAWIFAAGLVLGFSLFAEEKRREDLEQAFLSCREVLSKLASRSPLAAQYRDVLHHLYSAILEHRKRQDSRYERSSQPLVERIMSLRPERNQEQADITSTNEQVHIQHRELSALPSDISTTSLLPGSQSLGDTTNDVLPDFDDFLVSTDDTLMYGIQNIGTMPWDVS